MKRITKAGLALSALLGVLTVATAALALDKQDILNLHQTGLGEEIIVNVIRGTTEDLEITAADVDELEAAGVPGGVISELRLRLGITGGGGSGGSGGLQQDLEEQRRLEEERRRLEQERIEAEREQMRQQLENERAREVNVASEFQGLRRAQSLADEGDYLRAAAIYSRFLEEVQPVSSSDEYYEAKFGLVRSLHGAGARASIRADALEVALMGANRRHFESAVRILRDVVNDSGFNSPRISDLSNEVVASFSPEFQDEFNYFMGRYYYSAGELQQALSYLGLIDSRGAFGARAAFLSGVIQVNPELGQNIAAVGNLQQAIVLADLESETDREVTENAYLALARIAYQVGNFGGALFYYQQIPVESPRRTTALFEESWSYFLNGDFNRALGSFQSLHSPYHNHRFFPDLYVLEAASYLYTCNIDQAFEAVATFEEEVGTLRDTLREFVANAADPNVYYRAAADPAGSERAGDPDLPEDARRVILADADFYRIHRVLQTLRNERGVIAEADLGERGDTALEALDAEITNKELEAAVLVYDVVQNLLNELDDWWFRGQEVEIEILDLQARYLETILNSGEEAAFNEGSTFVILADDWQFWPWEGEYWLDEVGSYRGNVPMRCPDDIEW